MRDALTRLALATGTYRPARLAYEAWRRPRIGRDRQLLRQRLSPWVRPGDLAFDVGAHLGRFTQALHDLGARVVAVEPNPATARELRGLHGPDRDDFTLVHAGIGDAPGTAELRINARRHSMCTLSTEFIAQTRAHAAWAADDPWDRRLEVAVTTLDAIIAKHGLPRLIKLDVEGFELPALCGLSATPELVCFEYRARMAQAGGDCVRRLAELGGYRFNVVGTDDSFLTDAWLEPGEALALLSGDERATRPSHVDVFAWRAAVGERRVAA